LAVTAAFPLCDDENDDENDLFKKAKALCHEGFKANSQKS